MNCRQAAAVAALTLPMATGMAGSEAPAVYLVQSGKAACTIVLPGDATGGEAYAARELQDHIRQIGGVELARTTETLHSPAAGPCISIGRTQLSRKHVTDEQMAAFGDEGYRVFCRDGNAFFVGGRKRGSLYAVYDYLESLGVRWYSPTYTVIPRLADVAVSAGPIEFTPKLHYRCQYWNNGFSPQWLARMRLNGNISNFEEIPESMGGCITAMHNCHSYDLLLPPGQNFAKHPEWYALKKDGKRSPHEWCLANPELRDFITSRVLSDLRAARGQAGSYWVSQNDGGADACFCGECTAQRVAHGGADRWSANTIAFVSDIAERVKAEFPGVMIRTLAYNYTKAPPENMKGADNVLVEICGNFGSENSARDHATLETVPHEQVVNAWSKIVKNISVYTYGGSNYGYWWPFPNLYDLGMQAPWALANGVTAFYVQGTALGKGSGMVDLRAYLTARLAWDPSRDVKKEIRDFCDGFYGPAGRYIVEYEDWYADYLARRKMKLYVGWGEGDAWRVWVTRDAMDHAEELFQKAMAAVKDQPVFLGHVRRAYLEVLWGQVMLALKPVADNNAVFLPGVDVSGIRAKARLFGEIMRENGYTHLGEWLKYEPGNNLIDSAARE